LRPFHRTQSTFVTKAGGTGGGEIETASFTFTRAADRFFYFGLNFIAKVFHNQNLMLAPPLSSRFAGWILLFLL
jgi:hypothetical protein